MIYFRIFIKLIIVKSENIKIKLKKPRTLNIRILERNCQESPYINCRFSNSCSEWRAPSMKFASLGQLEDNQPRLILVLRSCESFWGYKVSVFGCVFFRKAIFLFFHSMAVFHKTSWRQLLLLTKYQPSMYILSFQALQEPCMKEFQCCPLKLSALHFSI